MYITTQSGQWRLRKSTVGWDMKVAWTNGSESWVPLSLIKNSNPIETPEFAVAWDLASEPDFSWCVPYTLRKIDTIISAVKARIKRVSHKYGVELPKSVKEALEIDAKNGNNLWRDAIEKEMINLKVAFDILDDYRQMTPGYKRGSGHIIFDVRMTLERKEWWVKEVHRTWVSSSD